MGSPALSVPTAIGASIIKECLGASDEEIVEQIRKPIHKSSLNEHPLPHFRTHYTCSINQARRLRILLITGKYKAVLI
jgi:hypothetical protein